MKAMASSPAAKPKPTTTLRVAAFSGSLRKGSWHGGLIRAAQELCEESIPALRRCIPGLRIDHVDISGLPMANPDLETDDGDGFPPDVEAFRDRVRAADCFLFASPEYNYSVTATLKNALDWASRGKHKGWADKAAAIVSAGGSCGGGRAAFHLRQIGVFLDIHFINKPELQVRAYEDPPKFDADGNLVDAETRERLKQVLLSLQAFALRLQH
ncbi:probable NADPH:quinone oxidoreductase 1 [Triticum dicoccoides]|uniref:probable NADPH:quinone oxidoreductase 1 n=1 Tax=Triticum dicoccoides TaxID=85692 RepID=UPI00188E15F7|nr:probable NADPH:quinone oxidoreductase 1 [Triticum dicoccoides]XP_044337919.1 probable NADPH:quinone oxidoreductase 1 [Triticum aestivum]